MSRERRRYPRVDVTFPLKVGRGREQMATATMNLSCSGALCRLPGPLPLMTKVSVALALPRRLIQCTGVVVRCEPESRAVRRRAGPAERRGAGYQVALFFPEISRPDHRAIAEFVLDSMLTHAHGHRRS